MLTFLWLATFIAFVGNVIAAYRGGSDTAIALGRIETSVFFCTAVLYGAVT